MDSALTVKIAVDKFAEAGVKAWARETYDANAAKAAEVKLAIAIECLRWYAQFGNTTAIEYDCGQRAKRTLEIFQSKAFNAAQFDADLAESDS